MSLSLRLAIALAVALVLTVPAVWLGWRALRAARRSLRLLRAVCGARRAEFAELRPGPVALRGRVVPIDPLVSEESGRRGVYLAHTIDRWERSGAIGGIGGGAWLRVAEGEEAAPFELTDGDSAVLVEPAGATFRVPYVSGELDVGQTARVRYREALLEEGAEAVVVGEATPQGGFDPSSGYRGHNLRTVVQAGSRGELLVAAARGLVSSTLLQLLLQLTGALPALGLLALDLCLLGNYLPQTAVRLPDTPSSGRVGAPPARFHPWLGEELLRQEGVVAVGPARLELRCLGYCTKPGERLYELARVELWRRGLDGMAGSRYSEERRHLIFHVASEQGTAVRLPESRRSGPAGRTPHLAW